MITKMEQLKVRWVRLTLQRAKERWFSGDAITLVPCKCHPDSLHGFTTEVYPEGYLQAAKGDRERAWYLMYREWSHSNTSFALGAGAHFYIAKRTPEGIFCGSRQ